MNRDIDTDTVIVDDPHTRRGQRRGGVFKAFLIGLIIGLLLAGLVYLIHKIAENSNASNNAYVGQVDKDKGQAIVGAGSGETFYATTVNYSSSLIETARESDDAPSTEATAAQDSLTSATGRLVSALGGDTTLRADMNAFNTAVIAYATADGSDTGAVDSALTKVTDDLKGKYDLTDEAGTNAAVTTFKNSVVTSLNNFKSEDYAGSYSSQVAAGNALLDAFAHLKNK